MRCSPAIVKPTAAERARVRNVGTAVCKSVQQQVSTSVYTWLVIWTVDLSVRSEIVDVETASWFVHSGLDSEDLD